MSAPSAKALLAALDETWPAAETVERDGWRLRRGAGGGRRVSAATALSENADIGAAEAAMTAWGQEPLFQLRPGEDALDDALAARGYLAVDRTGIYSAPTALLLDDQPEAVRIIRGPTRIALIDEIWTKGGVGSARLAVMDRAAEPKTYIIARIGDRPAAVAFVGVAKRIAMLHAVETLAEQRRKGAARMLIAAAARFAVEEGADALTLAVTERNEAARALYLALGMTVETGYHYRVKPAQ